MSNSITVGGKPEFKIEYSRTGDMTVCIIIGSSGELASALVALTKLIEADTKGDAEKEEWK